MSLQWTLIAGFLYLEIFITLLLVLPIASPQRWTRFLNSNFMKTLRSQAQWYFFLILIILVLFLLDAVREMRKYSNVEFSDHTHQHLDTEMQANMRLFRAQRNFYISGFALFLSVVIRRILNLLSTQANLIAQSEAALKQAQGASAAARTMLKKDNGADALAKETYENEIKELKEALKSLEEKYGKAKQDKDAVKSQAESVTKEYDRLLEEHRKLQESVFASGDKKKE